MAAYVVFELANSHGGSKERLLETVERIRQLDYSPKGIKLQVFKPDLIALPDYPWYGVYQELYQPPAAWEEIISATSEVGEVWLDIFDTYGVEILAFNKSRIAGVKLQASVLDNLEVLQPLEEAGAEALRLMINVSGHELSAISEYLGRFGRLGFREIILQIGYQSYPTRTEDTALQKIPVLRAAFPKHRLCFADHAPGDSAFALQVPALAFIAGCEMVEKHICLSRAMTRHDFQSAIEPAEAEKMLAALRDAAAASHGDFVGAAEADYLRKTVQVPVVRHTLPAGSLVGKPDLWFRRTGQSGLGLTEIILEQGRHRVLAEAIKSPSVLSSTVFRPARIGVIVACRMKSSRLKQKARCDIAGRASVERCLENCLRIPEAEVVVLATSTLEEDAVLRENTLGGRVQFFQGDPEDVIARYAAACDAYKIDVLVRVTADCPAVSAEIAGQLLESHFANGADFSKPRDYAIGTDSEVYNAEVLKRILRYLGKAPYSEYMTWYLRNNAHLFKVNLVDLPAELVRPYRLTLDYPEDLTVLDRIYRELGRSDLPATLENVFGVLDRNPELAEVNSHLDVAYRSDPELIDRLNKVTRIRRDLNEYD